MPLYFFHLCGDDDEGTEYASDDAARAAALDTFGAMIRDGALGPSGRMEVAAETGQRLLTLSFSIEP
jgi:hypothetical protein